VAVGFSASAAGVALNVQGGAALGGEGADSFPVERRAEPAADRMASASVSTNTLAHANTARSKATTILIFIN
jgi:hypothetical protein